jgi:hypothetical protein
MDGDQSSDNRFIFNSDMSGKCPSVGDNATAADQAIMSDMRIGHKQVVVSDPGLAAVSSAGIKGAEFADNIIIAYLKEHFLAFKF